MIEAPDAVRRYESAKHRFLKSGIINFFERELPKLFGPVMREKLADELIALISQAMPEKEHVKPGQVVWNALDIKTRGDSPERRFVPVILTLIAEEDCKRLAEGTKMSEIAEKAVARITREAFEQGAILSMRDIGLLTWRMSTTISRIRISYEKKEETILPHTGYLHDMGTCISHKKIIIQKAIFEKKDPTQVARETNHSLVAVERYIKDFRRIETCYNKNPDIDFVSKVTGIAKHVVKSYIQMFQ
jgi:hypothetical protein